MDAKLEYDLDQQLEKPSLAKISVKAMAIWRETQEGTVLYNLAKELVETIDMEQKKFDDIKSVLSLATSKL